MAAVIVVLIALIFLLAPAQSSSALAISKTDGNQIQFLDESKEEELVLDEEHSWTPIDTELETQKNIVDQRVPSRNLRSSAPPKGCKYNLKKIAWISVNANSHEYNDGIANTPGQFRRNHLPAAFQSPCNGGVKRPWVMAIRTIARPRLTRYIGGCLGHHGSHIPEAANIALYDCNGTVLQCDSWYYKVNIPKYQEILAVITPSSQRRPSAFWFIYSKRKPHLVWCDWYPF